MKQVFGIWYFGFGGGLRRRLRKLVKRKRIHVGLRIFLVVTLVVSWTLAGWPQIPFTNFPPKIETAQAAVTYSVDCDGTIQTAASAVAITACDVGTGLTDAILIISVFGDDGGGTHGAPTVTRGTGSTCGTATETATIIDTEVTDGDAIVSTWRLLDANFAEGSADVCVSWASSDPPDEWSAHITVFTGVNQSTFTSATSSATPGNVSVVTSTITIATDEHGYQANSCNNNATVTTLHTDDVERFILTTAGADRSTSHVSTQTVTGSPATMGVTLYSKTCTAAAMKLIALNPAAVSTTLTQDDFRWYVDETTVTLTDLWGTVITGDNEDITAVPVAMAPPVSGDKLRLQINLTVTGANMAAGTTDFILEYKEGTDQDCSTGSWTAMGAKSASGTDWRFFANGTLVDKDPEVNQISTSDVVEDYVESDPTDTNPNAINIDQSGEWDFAIETGTTFKEATSYAFRLIQGGTGETVVYSDGDCPTLETAPGTANLLRHGNFFVSEVEKGFFWAD